MGFLVRHWTAVLILLVIAGWALFYLPNTPSWAVYQLKRDIDARDGHAAANYIDFQKVVRNAGYEMVQGDKSGGDDAASFIGQLIGKSAVDLFSGPMASLTRSWAINEVDNGAKEVQMPNAAVVGAIVLLHRDEGTAYTRWTDRKGQVWEVQMAREPEGWQIVEVKNVRQLLEKLRQNELKEFNAPSYAPPPPAPLEPPDGSR